MLYGHQDDPNVVGIAENRGHARLQLGSLAYVELTEENAGLILDISETGIAVQAVQLLTSNSFPRMQFRLPKTDSLIEAPGRIVWQIPSKKLAGIEFVGLPDKTTARIRAWIAAEQQERTSQPVNSLQAPMAEEGQPATQSPARTDTPPLHEWESKAPSTPAASGVPPEAVTDWIKETWRPIHDNLGSRAGSSQERASGFDLHPFGAIFPSESDAEHAGTPEPIRAVPRRKESIAPETEMAPKKPRRWWTYSAVLGLIALAFAAGMMFNAGPTSPDRIEALNRSRSKPVADAESGGQNGQANRQQRQSNTAAAGNAQHSQSALSQQPVSPNNAGPSASATGPLAIVPDVAPPPTDTAKNSIPSGLTQPPAADSSAGASEAGRGQSQREPGSERYHSQNSEAQNAFTPHQPVNRYSADVAHDPQATTVRAYNRFPRQQTPAAKAINTSSAPVQSARTQPQPNQNRGTQAANANTGNLQTQRDGAGRLANQDAIEVRREQSPQSATRPLTDPAASTANQQPVHPDLYAHRAASGPPSSNTGVPNASGPSTGTPGAGNQVTSAVPSTVPGGSVGSTSQFHGFVIPPDLQSRNSQVSGQLRIGQTISSYPPMYPVEALREGIQGTVKLDVVVGQDGNVKNVQVISGPAMLTSAAAAAVRDWRYSQTFVAGEPVEAREYVAVVFRLAGR